MSLPALITLLQRERRLFAAVFLVALAAGAIVTFSLPDTYRTTATLAVGENRPLTQGGNLVQLDELLTRTYAELLRSSKIEAQVARSLSFRRSAAELGDVEIEPVPGTQLITITAASRSPVRAKEIANAFAEAFVRSQRRSIAADTDDTRELLNGLSRRLSLRIAELNGRQDPEAQAELEQLRSERQAVRAAYTLAEQDLVLRRSNVSFASAAELPGVAAEPRPKLYLAVAAVLALALALAATLIRTALDKRVHNEEELIELAGSPVIARIPKADLPAGAPAALPRDAAPAMDEAFEFLRTSLRLEDRANRARVIAVTSPLPGDGKTLVVTRLSSSLGLGGARVIAADCDLRKPMLHHSFSVNGGRRGATSALVAGADPRGALKPTANPNVRVLTSGPRPSLNPSVLLGTQRLPAMLHRLREAADYVILDTPPLAVGADASVVVAAADGVLLVVDPAQARRDVLENVIQQLDKAGSPVLGVVLNRVAGDSLPYYYGYYHDDHSTAARREEPAGVGRSERRA